MRATTTMFVSKGQYYLTHTASIPPPTPSSGRSPGMLLYPAPASFEDGGVLVSPGTFDGPVLLTVEIEDGISEQDPGQWEVVDEVDVTARGADLFVFDTEEVYEELPVLKLAAGDQFHLRLFVNGYEAGRAAHMVDPDAEPVEFHLLQAWRTSS